MINQTGGVTKGTRLFIGQIDLIALGIGKIKWLIIVNYYVLIDGFSMYAILT